MFCDEHLFGQVNTSTGHNQLPILHCTNMHLRRSTHLQFRCAVLDDVMSQSELATLYTKWKMETDMRKVIFTISIQDSICSKTD